MILKRFEELTVFELYRILALRNEVFVVEQNCPYQDLDDKDQNSLHLFKMDAGVCIAYARLLPSGLSYPEASIGRVVTSKIVRGRGYGIALMKEAIQTIKTAFNPSSIRISAQLYLKTFYESFGFQQDGDGYLEDGIPHIPMILIFN